MYWLSFSFNICFNFIIKTNKTDNISFLNGDSIYLLDTSVSRKYINDSLSIQNNNGELIDYKIENLFKEAGGYRKSF